MPASPDSRPGLEASKTVENDPYFLTKKQDLDDPHCHLKTGHGRTAHEIP